MTSITTTGARVTLARDDVGTGEPALLFVPGWCGDRSEFSPLLPHASAHRRCLSVDLPDHGQSPRRADDYGLAEVVDELVCVLGDSTIDRVVPVGASHAGWAAIELRRRLGAQRVPAVVLLDWMPLGTPPGFTDALAGLQSQASWEQVRGALFGMWTAGVDNEAVLAYVSSMGEYGFEHWSRAGREIGASFAACPRPVDALADLECATLHLYAQPADDAVLAMQRAYSDEHPWFQVARLDARSHFPMFEVPDVMAEHIDGFLRTV